MVHVRAAHPDELSTVIAVDDDASRKYALAGVHLGLTEDHPFVVAERARWALSVGKGDAFLAIDGTGAAVGVAVLGHLDGLPYLDQLSVRLEAMGQGVGSALLDAAVRWAASRGGALWLNTYRHLPWNEPFYARRGFVPVEERLWGPGMRAVVEEQRRHLPFPDQRVVMVRRPDGARSPTG